MKTSSQTLTLISSIEAIILTELKNIIYRYKGSPYIKFLLLVNSVEFLGSCLDEHEITKTKESEERFNKALKKLFDKKYHKYANKNSNPYFFSDLRCGMIHQLRPLNHIAFTTREESEEDGNEHLKSNSDGHFILVLEDFYDDLEKATNKLIRDMKSGKITHKKGEKGFLDITSYS